MCSYTFVSIYSIFQLNDLSDIGELFYVSTLLFL